MARTTAVSCCLCFQFRLFLICCFVLCWALRFDFTAMCTAPPRGQHPLLLLERPPRLLVSRWSMCQFQSRWFPFPFSSVFLMFHTTRGPPRRGEAIHKKTSFFQRKTTTSTPAKRVQEEEASAVPVVRGNDGWAMRWRLLRSRCWLWGHRSIGGIVDGRDRVGKVRAPAVQLKFNDMPSVGAVNEDAGVIVGCRQQG